MSRTEKDIKVYGRTMRQVRDEVVRWMNDHSVHSVEDRPEFLKGRIGIPAGLGLTAPKYFEILLKDMDGGVKVHTEGFIGVYGVSEMDFAADAISAAIPRRQGWKTISDLWRRLEGMSTGKPTPAPAPQAPMFPPPQAYGPPPAASMQAQGDPNYPCLTCGTFLVYVQQYQKWYCPGCQKYDE